VKQPIEGKHTVTDVVYTPQATYVATAFFI